MMGKLLLCSSSETFSNISKNIIGFKQNAYAIGNFGSICTYSKINVETENMVFAGNDFCAGVGTFVYKSKIGRAALEMLLADFSTDADIRSEIVGSYCIVVNKCNKVYVFVDPASTYNIYYNLSDDGSKIALTNTYFHIAAAQDEVNVNELKMISMFQIRAINGNTPFDGINKLMGTQMLVFEEGGWNIRKLDYPKIDFNISVVDKAVSMYHNIAELYSSSGVFMTGGQDSRLALALMLNRGMKPTLYYGIGNSEYTNTKTQDLECVKAISEKYNLPFQTMNWSNTDSVDCEYCFKQYGEMSFIYAMNTNVFNEFVSKIKDEFLAFGYFGEVYRNVEIIEGYQKELYTLDDFVDDLYMKHYGGIFIGNAYAEYRADIRAQFEDVCKINNLDTNALTKQDFQTLNTVYRQRWDTIMNNFANQFCYSMPLFGDYQLTKRAETTDYTDKEQSRFLLSCMKKLQEDIVYLPFFSHIKVKKYDPQEGTLYDAKLVSRIKEDIRAKIRSKRLMRFARKMYYIILRDKKGQIECKQQFEEKMRLGEEWNELTHFITLIDTAKMFENGSARGLKQIILYCKLIDVVKSKCLEGKDSE